MRSNVFLKFLFRYNGIIQPILSFLASLFFGLYLSRIENEISNGSNWFSALKNIGITNEIIIAFIFVLLVFLYHYFLMIKPIKRFEKNKTTTINALLESITKALFLSYGTNLEVSAVVQICDYKKQTREVKYHYNTSDMSFEKMDLFFGDVGDCCVKQKEFFMKEFSYEKWLGEDEKYHQVVPQDLRMILAKPIFDKKHNVIAVLEIDIFENTNESNNGSTKKGYITETVKISELKNAFSRRHDIKVMFKRLADSIATLIEF